MDIAGPRIVCLWDSLSLAHLLNSVSEVTHPIRIRTGPSLWCSAACPTGPKALFAIGTSEGLYTVEGYGSHWTLCHKPFPMGETEKFRRKPDSSHTNVSAVEWLSSDVIASGLRNSSVFLHDLRSGGSATRLQHSHIVTKIRKLDPYRLMVAGYNSVSDTLNANPNPRIVLTHLVANV